MLSTYLYYYYYYYSRNIMIVAILIGSCFGRLIGQLLHAIPLDGNESDALFGTVGTYALIGATAMLGGVTRMTISLTVILLETTNEIQYLLPIMLTLMVSKWVGDFFNISLYDLHVELKCIPFVEANPPLSLQGKCARDVMVTPVISLQRTVKVGVVLPILRSTTHNGFPIIDDDGRCIGLILRNQIVVMLRERAFARVVEGGVDDETDAAAAAAAAPPLLATSAFATTLSSRVFELAESSGSVADADDGAMLELPNNLSREDAEMTLDLRPYYNTAPYMVQDCWPLARVYRLYRCMGVRHLPVVDRECKLVGILSRKELQTDFTVDLA